MLDRLIHLVSNLGHWGYLVIFLAVTLESAAFLGFIMPGETLAVLGGFLAGQGVLELKDLIALVAIGAILGDSIGYEMGRWLGLEWLVRRGRWLGLKDEYVTRVQEFFQRHGGKTVFLARFSVFFRIMVPFFAGAARLRYAHFLFYNVLGGLLWSIGVVMLGYLAGQSWELVHRWIGRASALLAVVLIMVFLILWLWRWLWRHEGEVKRWRIRVATSPRIARLSRRFAPVIVFLAERLNPAAYLGLRLTVGILVLVGAAWIFGVITHDVLAARPLTTTDETVAIWLHDHATRHATSILGWIAWLGGPAVITSGSLLLAFVLLVRRSWYRLLELALVVPGGLLLNRLLESVFHRQGPLWGEPLSHFYRASFPSGQTAGAVLLFGLLLLYLLDAAAGWRRHVSLVLATTLLVLLIAFSTLYLGTAYLSDALAGIFEGIAWLALCHTGIELLRRSRQANL